LLRARLQDEDRVRIFEQDSRYLGAAADLLLSMEVLEHIEDDRAALANWCDLVRPGGHIVISVPAHQRRFSAEDEMAGHFRRYEKPELQEKLMAAGFALPRIMNYGFPLGLVLKQLRTVVAGQRMKNDRRSRQQRTEASGVERKRYRPWAALLNDWTMTPFHWMQVPFLNFDLGDGLLAVAQKPAV
jgi:SAM-dependent methyltransferase